MSLSRFILAFFLFGLFEGLSTKTVTAQAQTTNSSTLTNSAAPSASSITSGGTNINYQTNNTYNNEMGFGPGIFCRTPSLYVGGNWGEGFLDNYNPFQLSGNNNLNYSFNAGVIVPFGSSVIDHCKQLAASIARDREISSQLSMLRTCAQLEKEGLVVDPVKYPLLKPCIKDKSAGAIGNSSMKSLPNSSIQPNQNNSIKPKTTRVL
jgi:hypothetical protein